MDSSRSGLLSTLLMTLPLIVVPAIALLRPPGPTVGVSTSSLDAAPLLEDDLPGEFQVADESFESDRKSSGRATVDDDGFGGLFAEPGGGRTKKPQSGKPTKPRSNQSVNPFDGPLLDDPDLEGLEGLTSDELTEPDADDSEEGFRVVPSSSAESIVEQLTVQGALRTMWFEAGDKSPVGFAAFFRGETDLMRIRFEAVGESREACARNVLEQVTRWQAEQAQENLK